MMFNVIFILIKIIYVLVVKNVLKNVPVDFLTWFSINTMEIASSSRQAGLLAMT